MARIGCGAGALARRSDSDFPPKTEFEAFVTGNVMAEEKANSKGADKSVRPALVCVQKDSPAEGRMPSGQPARRRRYMVLLPRPLAVTHQVVFVDRTVVP
jgi:hypothetical protein